MNLMTINLYYQSTFAVNLLSTNYYWYIFLFVIQNLYLLSTFLMGYVNYKDSQYHLESNMESFISLKK